MRQCSVGQRSTLKIDEAGCLFAGKLHGGGQVGERRIGLHYRAVRVIDNNAVHPGSIDLRDDRATAESLFRLLNLISENMISEPKHVDKIYATLPPNVLAAIETRDKKG